MKTLRILRFLPVGLTVSAISLALPPQPAAVPAPDEQPRQVQAEVVRELAAGVQTEQRRVADLNSEIDRLANESDPSSSDADQANDVAGEIEASDERLAELQASAHAPVSGEAAHYDQELDADAAAESAARDQLRALNDDIQSRRKQLALDTPVLQQLLDTNIPSTTIDAFHAQVDTERAELAQQEENYRDLELAATASAEQRRAEREREQRADTYSAELDIERAANEELSRRQALQNEYTTLQKAIADRARARDQAADNLRSESQRLDRMTAELAKQRDLLARIEQS